LLVLEYMLDELKVKPLELLGSLGGCFCAYHEHDDGYNDNHDDKLFDSHIAFTSFAESDATAYRFFGAWQIISQAFIFLQQNLFDSLKRVIYD